MIHESQKESAKSLHLDSQMIQDSSTNGSADKLSAELSVGQVKRSLEPVANPAAFSIQVLFQIMTASALFFACLRFSPLLAISLTILFAPAIIRTGQISEMHRQKRKAFGHLQRVKCFLNSIVVVILTAAFATLVFALVSLGFGLLGMLLSIAIGSADLSIDAAIVGTASGMIWGFAAALLAIGFVLLRMWLPKEILTTRQA